MKSCLKIYHVLVVHQHPRVLQWIFLSTDPDVKNWNKVQEKRIGRQLMKKKYDSWVYWHWLMNTDCDTPVVPFTQLRLRVHSIIYLFRNHLIFIFCIYTYTTSRRIKKKPIVNFYWKHFNLLISPSVLISLLFLRQENTTLPQYNRVRIRKRS